jgi:hypothetical protein
VERKRKGFLMTSKRVLDHVHAAVAATVDGRSVIWDVALDLEVVLLPGQFAASDDAAIEHACLSPGYSLPQGGPYTVRYSYRGRTYEQTVWGDENGQLVAVKP